MVAYISQSADNKIISALKQEGFEIVLLAPFSALEAPVDTHADMLICRAFDTLFLHKDYPCAIDGEFNIIKVDEEISSKYPNDILLNIAVVGKNVFANTKFASKTVLEHLEKNGFAIHHVSQGYAHCSTCIVSDNAIVTADQGIADKAQNIGLQVLKIESGSILLPPYQYGFIGGSCGSYENKIYFCGSLDYHPDGERIRQFCKLQGKRVIELSSAPLSDVGGILFV